MQVSWPTFLLEIVNFLILVWILKRFLYRPVLAAIAQRKAAIDKTLSDAQTKRAQSEQLEQQYENRLADWEKEKENLHASLVEELNAERERLVAELQTSLEQEREKERVLAQRRVDQMARRAAEHAREQGVRFTARLLARMASPELEGQLIQFVLEDIPRLPEAQRAALKDACGDPRRNVKIASAFPVPEGLRAQLTHVFNEAIGGNIIAGFEQDPTLMAGLRISVGPWMVRANLQDELQFFAAMMSQTGGIPTSETTIEADAGKSQLR